MAVVNVQEGFSDEASGATSDDGKTGEINADRGFTVLVDDPVNDNEFTAQFANGIPRVRDIHPRQGFLRCNDVRVRKIGLILYHVLCRYSAPFFEPGESPLTMPAKVHWGSASEEVDVDEDVHGKPILAFGDIPAGGVHTPLLAFDPPLTRRHSDKTLTITRNQSTFDPVFYSTFENTTNSNVLFVAGHAMPPGTCLCIAITAEKMDEDQFHYWAVTYEFHFRRGAPRTTDQRAWWARVLNASYVHRVDWPAGVQAGLFPARGVIRGRPAPKPMLVAADGIFVDDPTQAHWQEFEIYGSSNFGLLML